MQYNLSEAEKAAENAAKQNEQEPKVAGSSDRFLRRSVSNVREF